MVDANNNLNKEVSIMVLLGILFSIYFINLGAHALDNGLALTPPMGWLSWERYLCNTDCVNNPDSCISEKLYRTMADLLVSEGYKDVGYEYVNIDDCWMSKERATDGSLVADPVRFPNGIKALADYVHSKGLKLGIYEDFGTLTCGGYPGSKFYLQLDAETFASWGIDMLKLDGCYTSVADMAYGYPAMEFFMNRTGHPMLYSCSWPAYVSVPYKTIAKYCNIWRNYHDIGDSWSSVKSIIEYYGNDKGNFSKVAGPGNFNDPDMIIVGDFGLSYDQERTQMALWAIMAAPLLMSNNLREIRPSSKALLQNREIIRINQDPLGIQGTRILTIGNIEVWTRLLAPKGKSIAFAFLNTAQVGGPQHISIPMYKLGATEKEGYNVSDVIDNKFISVMMPHDVFKTAINPTGVFLGRADFDP